MAYQSDLRLATIRSTMYIAGTSRSTDVRDDLLLPIPDYLGGGVRKTRKFFEAQSFLMANPHIRRIVGHSLGAAVAKALARDHGLDYEIYNNPGWHPLPGAEDGFSHTNYWDPVSHADSGKAAASASFNPHDYHKEADRHRPQ